MRFAAILVVLLSNTVPLAAQQLAGGGATRGAARYLPLESVRGGVVRMPGPLARRVSVRRRDVPLQQVVLDITTQARLGLSYGEDLARANVTVSIDIADVTAADALSAAVQGTAWTVLVTATGQVAIVPASRDLLGSIVGRISDAVTGAGVGSGVITIDGTRLVVTADDSGRFMLRDLPVGVYTLTARRIGYSRRVVDVEIRPDHASALDLTLEATATALDQVVVTGLPGATARRSVGHAVSSVDVAQVTRQSAATTVTEVLQARAPGVTVLPGGGSPGTGASIRIRGASSLVAGTAPVVFVDGVRVFAGAQGHFWNSWRSQRSNESSWGAGQDAMALDMIPAEDIEIVEVIKGPAAATLYGAEAANGVVQIITKRGIRGSTKREWSARLATGTSSWAVDRVTNYTSCTEFVRSLRQPDGSPRFPGCQNATLGAILQSRSLDLPGALRSGDVRSYGFSLRGGGSRHAYFVGGDRDEEEGVFLNSAHQRSSARTNVTLFPTDALDVVLSLGYSHTRTWFPINDDGFGLIQAAMLWRPGSAVAPGGREGFYNGAPEDVYQWDNQLRANRLTVGGTVSHRPRPWLRSRLTIGSDVAHREARKLLPPGSLWGGERGLDERGTPQNTLYTVDYASTADHALPFSLAGAASIGVQYTANRFRNRVERETGPLSSVVDDAASTEHFSEATEQKSFGVYLQEHAHWRERLFLTAALRVDNNSVFGEEIRRLFYPKLAAAWIVSEEPWLSFLSGRGQLRLRAAWGQAGNAPAPFSGMRSFGTGTHVNDRGERVPALRTNAFGNRRIRPERGTEVELGIDGSLGSRTAIEVTWYDKRTSDALMAVPVPASTGFIGFRLENLGEIGNSGLEVGLSVTPVRREHAIWTTRLGYAMNRNRLLAFGYARDPIVLALYAPVQRHQPGYPLGGYWGTFPARNASGALVRDANGALIPGQPRYIGPSTPTRDGSLANTLVLFDRLRLHSLLDYKGGHHLYNVKDQFRCWGQPLAQAWGTDPARRVPGQCWEVNDPHRSTEEKEIRQQDILVNNGVFIQRADFVKIRELSLSFSLPTSWARRVGSTHTSLTLSAHNVGFLWKPWYTGPDPEVNFTGVDDPGGQFAYIRADAWTAPMTRRLTAALEVGF
jgi:TonB-dependent starch-binding outer membrane protein SusC